MNDNSILSLVYRLSVSPSIFVATVHSPSTDMERLSG